MTRGVRALAAACLAVAIGVACGDVPTRPHGVAYITPVLLPSPTVAWGDTLRDSLGRVAPLRVVAIGRDSTDTVRDVTLRFLLTSFGTGARIDANGVLVAPDSLTTARLVAQVTDGSALQLQTPEIPIEVVPRADRLEGARPDTLSTDSLLTSLPVTVTGVGPTGARAGVGGLRVRYRIAATYPAAALATGRYWLVGDGGATLRPDSTIAVDTTASSGAASRSIAALRDASGPNADSLLVEARALSHRGVELAGSPVRFLVRFRKP